MQRFKKLRPYQLAFDQALEVFDLCKSFPNDEKYELISQMRRSSRSVCSNIAEAYRKRNYPKHFVAKTSDAEMENSETSVWFDFAISFGYNR